MLVELIDEMRTLSDSLKSSDEAKVNVTSLIDSFDEKEAKTYAQMVAAVNKLDSLFHANYHERVSMAVFESVKKLTRDARARNEYLQSIATRQTKIELDAETQAKVNQLVKLRKKILATEMMLVADDVEIPKDLYKEGKSTLDLPRLPFNSTEERENEGKKARGRPSASKLLVLGTVEEDGEVVWHENDHISTTFVQLFGTVRSDTCSPGLLSAVADAGHKDITKNGWTEPVSYAGKQWVGKVRS